jgi:fumarate hydratase class II
MSQQMRVEVDSLGEVEVAADAYYGAQTQRAVENFPVSGLRPYRAFIWGIAVIKLAAAEVNRDLGLIEPRIAAAIVLAAQEVLDGKHDDQFVVDPFQAGAGTSHNMNANEVIANRAIELLGGSRGDYRLVSPNDTVNMAQSTNDVIPTAIRLGCLWRLDELLKAIDDLSDALDDKGREFYPIVKSGRTHLQDAVPVRLGQEFAAYAKALARDGDKVRLAAEGLRRLGIGGTATGTGLNAHPQYQGRVVARLAELCGFALYSSDNLFESMQSSADFVFFSGALRVLAQDLIRIANDLRLLASGPATGLDEIHMPAVQPGSSIMPGKVNPVLAEMLGMACFHVLGSDLTVTMSAQAGQLELNVMTPVIAHSLFDSMHILINAINAFTSKCVRGLAANRAKAEGWLAKNAILVTALNPVIGYARGAEVAKEAMATGMTIRDVVIASGYLSAEEADQLLDAARMTEGGIRGGNPGTARGE